MHPGKLIARGAAALFLLLWTTSCARADKIILKNGRKIVAFNVVEEGDKVRYETSAGQLLLPKSIVDHIEKDGLLPMMESPAAAAANLNIPPPALEATPDAAEIDGAAVHDGAVDREYISRLKSETRGGNSQANERATLACHAAAQFELSKGDLQHALDDELSALIFTPRQPVLLMDVAYLYLKRSEFKRALEYLDRARRAAPANPDVYKLAGWAYYGMNHIEQAVQQWEKSLQLRPDPDVQAALDKAQRDKAEEQNYRENESAHFQLKYNGTAAPPLAREVLHVLEDHFRQIESQLNYTPPEPIGVILYTQQAFSDITRAPSWVGAYNDGRIRVPVQGLTSVDSELSRVLRHELTHSFIQQKTHSHALTWIQEGVAQWMEGKRSEENAAVLVQVYDAGQAAPLAKLEGSWMGLPGSMAHYAYAWALANVEYIVQTQGIGDLNRILDRVALGSSAEQAVQEVLRDNYSDLMKETALYLKKNYLR